MFTELASEIYLVSTTLCKVMIPTLLVVKLLEEIGMTLGLSIGGRLLIREAGQGHVSQRDILSALTMLALCHSLIEDTLLMLLLGAHLSGVFWGRLLFTILALAVITRWLRRRDDRYINKYLFNRNIQFASSRLQKKGAV